MYIEPIEIDIDDNKQYAQVAFLVDKPTFIKKVLGIRRKYKVDSIMQTDNYFDTASDESLESLKKLKSLLFQEVAELRHEFGYTPYFDDVILQCILFHRVRAIKTTQVVMHLTKTADSQKLSDQTLELAILLTPSSTQKEVLKAFEDSKEYRADYKKYHPLVRFLEKDTLSYVVRDRKWHLDQLSGKKYSEMHNDWNNNPETHFKEDKHTKDGRKKRCELCKIDDENDIVKAVSRYRLNLESASFR